MTKLEKVQKGLAACELNNQNESFCREQGCPYADYWRRQECIGKLHRDAAKVIGKAVKQDG